MGEQAVEDELANPLHSFASHLTAALLDARRNPDKYRDLVVRVAGFSAFFIHLDGEVQEEVIKRTELRFN